MPGEIHSPSRKSRPSSILPSEFLRKKKLCGRSRKREPGRQSDLPLRDAEENDADHRSGGGASGGLISQSLDVLAWCHCQQIDVNPATTQKNICCLVFHHKPSVICRPLGLYQCKPSTNPKRQGEGGDLRLQRCTAKQGTETVDHTSEFLPACFFVMSISN